MKQTIRHGAVIDAVTPEELRAALDALREGPAQRIRATNIIGLDANGAGQDEVFTCPIGFEFEARRVMLDLDTATDPSVGNISLGAATGVQVLQQVANPAGGSDWAFVVPAGKQYRIRAIHATLTSSAVVANRLVSLEILDGAGNVVFHDVRPFQQPASTVSNYTWASGVTDITASNTGKSSLPGSLVLSPGWTVRVTTIAIDAGDQWSAINFMLEDDSTAGGRVIEYLRSGTRIEYAVPMSPSGALAQIPGIQTWGAEQGPYLRNGEVFEIRARGLTPNARLAATVEGIQRRPPGQ